jgi:hypothetical protein
MRRSLSCVLACVLISGLAAAPASAATSASRPHRAAGRPTITLEPFGAEPVDSPPGGLGALDVATRPGGVRALVESDDSIPGVPRQWWPGSFTGTVDAITDAYDVYPVFLEWDELAEFTLTSSAGDFDLYLYYPDGVTLAEASEDA